MADTPEKSATLVVPQIEPAKPPELPIEKQAIPDALSGLYRARPYGPARIINVTFAGTAGLFTTLWAPQNGYFEMGKLRIKGTAACAYAICDTRPDHIIGYIDTDGVTFAEFDPGMAAIRSLSYANARLLLVDLSGVAATLTGAVYGWEVSPAGFYR